VRRPAAIVAAALALAAAPASAEADVPAGCATVESPGGDWRSYGHDFANTRFQDAEKSISPADVPLLSPAWTFSTVQGEGDQRSEGDITGTPVVADGCVYAATNRGWIFAVNADTGAEVWRAKLPKGGGANNTVGIGKRRCNRTTERVRVRRSRRQIRRLRRRHPNRRIRRWRWVERTRWEKCGTIVVGATRTSDAREGGEGAEAVCPPEEACVGPYAAAFDQATGELVWATPPLDDQPGADLYGSPVIFKGTIMLGVSGGSAELGDEADRYAFQGSMSFIGIGSGRVLRKTWTIHPPHQPDDEFGGAGIWSTPAVDPEDRVAFVGSANPFKPWAEHPYSNAVLKYDVDRRSPAFGQIVGSYKGNVDEYFPGLSEMPCYDIPGNAPPYYPQGVGSCGDIDLDFGASPNLWTEDGRKLVGAGQKSGVYHVFDARTMEPVRSQIVGPPTPVGGIVGSTAHDGQTVFGPVTAPGYIWAIGSADVALRWIGPVADGAHWGPPVAVANGVVYSVDLSGFLDAYDARTGVQLAKRPLVLGGSSAPSLSWGGVSVARNTVYASMGIGSLEEGAIVAFRPGGPGDVQGDVQQTVTNILGGGDDGGGDDGGEGTGIASTIVAGPGAVYTTYATPLMTVEKGGPLSFANLDAPQHDVVSDDKGPDGRPVFQSRLSGLGEVTPVEGMDRVESGRQYGFFCSLHPGMRGTLIVR
jgi:outer membrane protein assembly factor BamB/plastocyanin